MTTEIIIKIAALAFIIMSIGWLVHIGRRDAERIFQSDYTALQNYIRECQLTEVNEARIILRLHELCTMKGADVEKLQVLNAEFRRRFSPELSDIVCHEDTEQ